MPRSPLGPRPPPRPGESVYSGSSGPDGSCSASHRLTHTHTVKKSVTGMAAKSNCRPKMAQGGTTKRLCSSPQPASLRFTQFLSRASSKLRAEVSICTVSNGQQKATEHTRSRISGKTKKGREEKAVRCVTVPVCMLSNLSSRWGLSGRTMHDRWIALDFRRQKQKPFLLTCRTQAAKET